MKIKIFVGIFIIILISSCATSNIKPEDTFLEPNQGILITKIISNLKGGRALIHHKDKIVPSATFDNLKTPEDLKVIKITEGEANFSRVMWGGFESYRDNASYFNIKPGVINYIGDFIIEWGEKDGRLGVIATHVDRENETIAEAKSLYPKLFEKYKYIKNIPKSDLKIMEDN